jgi:MOSC domain-containing protein YiiM
MDSPIVLSVNISPGGIPKRPVGRGEVTCDGIVGDSHNHEKHITPLQAFLLIDIEDIEQLQREGYRVYPGAMGENLTCRGLDVDSLPPGARLAFPGGLVLELTKARKPCYVLDSIDPVLKKVVVGRAGMYARVVEAGPIRAGERIDVLQTSMSSAP